MKIVAVTGVSTVGKTALAYLIAELLDCVVVCGDHTQNLHGVEYCSGAGDRHRYKAKGKLLYAAFSMRVPPEDFARLVVPIAEREGTIVLDTLSIHYYEGLANAGVPFTCVAISPPSWEEVRGLMEERLRNGWGAELIAEAKEHGTRFPGRGPFVRHLPLLEVSPERYREAVIADSLEEAMGKQEKLLRMPHLRWISYEHARNDACVREFISRW